MVLPAISPHPPAGFMSSHIAHSSYTACSLAIVVTRAGFSNATREEEVFVFTAGVNTVREHLLFTVGQICGHRANCGTDGFVNGSPS